MARIFVLSLFLPYGIQQRSEQKLIDRKSFEFEGQLII